MSDAAFEWAASRFAELRPDALRGAPGAIEYHAADLASLAHEPATDAQAKVIFDTHMADPISWDFAKSAIQMQMRAGIPLHPLLSRVGALMVGGVRPEWKPGRNENYDRDCIAIALIAGLRDRFDIKPTRNVEASTVSGADIVSKVMSSAGLNVSFDAIVKVWARRKQYEQFSAGE